MSFRMFTIAAIGLIFLYGLFTVGFPFLLALIIAIFLEPLVQLMMRITRMNRILSATAVCSLFTLAMLGLLFWIGVKLYSEFMVLLQNLPGYIIEVQRIFEDTVLRTQLLYEQLPPELIVQIEKGAESAIGALINGLTRISGSLLNFAGEIPNMLIFLIVFLVALFLTSFGLNTYKEGFLSLFETSARDKVAEVLQNLRNSIFGFLRAQLILSGLTYIVSLIGLLILDIRFAGIIALFIVIVDILPILGTGSVLVPWAIYNMIVGQFFTGIGLIILFLVITVFRRMVEPKILGDSIGIGPLSTLISLYVGLKLVGVIGVFLGPIVVIIYTAMRKVGLLNIKIKLE